MKNVHKSENIDHSDLVLFVGLGPAQNAPLYKYEGSIIYHKGKKGKYMKKLDDMRDAIFLFSVKTHPMTRCLGWCRRGATTLRRNITSCTRYDVML